jgi:hypothetical protein
MNNGSVICPPSRAPWLNGPVADSFNPYRDWLGLANGQRPATYYGLFGLKPLENDAAKIRKAIVRLVTRLRGIQPGDRTREWQKIIKELSLAKACLTDPAAKAAYDARLRAGRGATGKASREVSVAEPPASPQAEGGTSPAAEGKPQAPAKAQQTTKGSKAPAFSKDAPPAAFPPAAGSDASVPALPTSGAAGQTPGFHGYQLPPIPSGPPGDVGPPLTAAAQAGNAPAQGNQGYQLPPIPSGPPGNVGPPLAAAAQADNAPAPEYQGYVPPIPDIPLDDFHFPSGDAVPAGDVEPDAAANSADDMPFDFDPQADQYAIPADVFWDPNAEEAPQRTWTLAGVTIACLLLLVVVLGGLTGFVLYQRYNANLSLARARQPKPVKVAKPVPGVPRPAAPDPGQVAAELAQKKASLQKNLTELVAALAKRDLAAAQALVAQARANALSPDDQKTVAKYEKLSDDVREFWRILGARVRKFQPSEEVSLGKTRIVVVEAQEGRFSFRYGSKILSYTLETLPTWLVTALADANLADDGPSKELYGAFLALDPEGDRARAQALWAEAAQRGIPVDQLLPPLDTLPLPPGS